MLLLPLPEELTWKTTNSPFCSNPTNPFCLADTKLRALSRSTPTTSDHLRINIAANIVARLRKEWIFAVPNEAMHSEMRRKSISVIFYVRLRNSFKIFFHKYFRNITWSSKRTSLSVADYKTTLGLEDDEDEVECERREFTIILIEAFPSLVKKQN